MPSSNTKKDAPAVTGQVAPGTAGNGSTTVTIIPPAPTGSQAVPGQNSGSQGKGRFKNDKTHVLGIDSKVNTLALKFYDEQLPWTATRLVDGIKKTPSKDFQVLAIRHDRDEVTDGIWAVSKVEHHWHVIVRLVDQNRRIRVRQILAGLGIVYRPGLDDDLWKEHGVETIGNFAGYAVYLTHETAEAIRDAKERYDISEIVSNLTVEDIQQVREGYIRVSEKRKLTQEELIALDKEAYDRGYELKTLDDWFANQPFIVRSSAKIKVITDHYYHGVEARIKEHVAINRVCIYIQGKANKGKTYAAEHALLDMGLNLFRVKGGETGKFDDLSAAHDAILIDDNVCHNLLNMTEDYICRAYKRGRNNPPWTGKMFVVTSNLPFYDWLELSGMRIYRRDKHGDVMCDPHGGPVLTDRGKAHVPAMRSRFFLMHVETDGEGVSRLELDVAQEARRGSIEFQQAKIDIVAGFLDKFNAIIREYRPRQIAPNWERLSLSKDGSRKMYRCHCGYIGNLAPDTRFCENCKSSISAGTTFTFSELDFLVEASGYESALLDTLIEFARWFWSSHFGGLAWHMEQNPREWNSPGLEVGFAYNDALLKRAIRTVLPYFKGSPDVVPIQGKIYTSLIMSEAIIAFQLSELLRAVKLAWEGYFGDIPPLTEDPDYEQWAQRIPSTNDDVMAKVYQAEQDNH